LRTLKKQFLLQFRQAFVSEAVFSQYRF
jgi:hypothetical protein